MALLSVVMMKYHFPISLSLIFLFSFILPQEHVFDDFCCAI